MTSPNAPSKDGERTAPAWSEALLPLPRVTWTAPSDAAPAFSDDADVREALALLPSDESEAEWATAINRIRTTDVALISRLCRRLTERRYYPFARRLARLALRALDRQRLQDVTQRWEIARSEIISTYKDPEASAQAALALAESQLDLFEREHAGRSAVPSDIRIDVLAVAASIARRRWEATGDVGELRRAYELYRRAFDDRPLTANGYPAVNAAFVLDLFAWAVHDGDERSRSARSARSVADEDATAEQAVWRSPSVAARALRQQLVNEGNSRGANVDSERSEDGGYRQYWRTSVRTEAFFGLGELSAAATELRRLLEMRAECDLYLDVTLRQLGLLARIQRRPKSVVGLGDAVSTESGLAGLVEWQRLLAEHPDVATGLRGGYLGKVGVALSGGGFRAALFHVGLLARLAELDLLRHVEVLSCVSGGSIVGALYYLELRELLQSKHDAAIDREDYVAVIESVRRRLEKAIAKDIRNQLLCDARANFKSASVPGYSRTRRLGELLEEHVFETSKGAGSGVLLNDLYIEPPAERSSTNSPQRPFNPRLDNWRRRAKVPNLILNATCLNTGHVWQFTASWMGEPPMGGDARSRSLPRLRRIRFGDRKAAGTGVRLGDAVAASAAVPMTFEPLVLRGLYDGCDVVLADGGVHDNQGISSLLDQGCTSLIVSDASGQMQLKSRCGTNPIAVGHRSNDVLMSRVRSAQLSQVEALHEGRALHGLLVAHLMLGLDAGDLPPAYLRNPTTMAARTVKRTSYGVWADVQHHLAQIRTDLDAFHALESSALQESAYRMTFSEADGSLPWIDSHSAPTYRWAFRQVSPIIAEGADEPVRRRVVDELARGAQLFGRSGREWPAPVSLLALAATVSLGALSGAFALLHWTGTVAGIGVVVALAALSGTVLAWPPNILRRAIGLRTPEKGLWERVSGRAIALLVSPVVRPDSAARRDQYMARGQLDLYVHRGKVR